MLSNYVPVARLLPLLPRNMLFKQCTALINKIIVILVFIVYFYFLSIRFNVHTQLWL